MAHCTHCTSRPLGAAGNWRDKSAHRDADECYTHSQEGQVLIENHQVQTTWCGAMLKVCGDGTGCEYASEGVHSIGYVIACFRCTYMRIICGLFPHTYVTVFWTYTGCSLNIEFFSLKLCDFSELCKICCSAGVLPLPGECTHTNTEGKQRKARVGNIFKKSEKKHDI